MWCAKSGKLAPDLAEFQSWFSLPTVGNSVHNAEISGSIFFIAPFKKKKWHIITDAIKILVGLSKFYKWLDGWHIWYCC